MMGSQQREDVREGTDVADDARKVDGLFAYVGMYLYCVCNLLSLMKRCSLIISLEYTLIRGLIVVGHREM
jgi:hypothetical protein